MEFAAVTPLAVAFTVALTKAEFPEYARVGSVDELVNEEDESVTEPLLSEIASETGVL